jgi:hypothetical protein
MLRFKIMLKGNIKCQHFILFLRRGLVEKLSDSSIKIRYNAKIYC